VTEGKTIDKKYDVLMLISPQTKLADYEDICDPRIF